jgi:tetratricopeptide (TPR) repeat protein
MSLGIGNFRRAAGLYLAGLLLMPTAAWSAEPAAKKPPALLAPLKPQMDSSYSSVPGPAPAYEPDMAVEPPSVVSKMLAQALQLYGQGQSQQAERLFNRVLSLDPHNVDAYYNLGAISEQKGNPEEALRNYQRALDITPGDSELQQAAAAMQAKLQEKQLARNRQQQLTAAQARQQETRNRLKKLADDAAVAYRNANYDLAVRNLEMVAVELPDDPDVQFGLAQAYRGKDNMAQARLHMNRAVALDPGNQSYRKVLDDLMRAGSKQALPPPDSATVAADGMPPVAPSRFQRPNYNPVATGGYQPAGEVTPFAAQNDNTPAGQITPFAPVADSPRQYGYAYDTSGSGMMSSTRMRRAVTSGVTGAAMGALMGSFGGGGRRGAMSGALFGGMAGLLFGGLR